MEKSGICLFEGKCGCCEIGNRSTPMRKLRNVGDTVDSLSPILTLCVNPWRRVSFGPKRVLFLRNQVLVHRDGLGGDCLPRKMIFDASTTCFPELFRFCRAIE
jgi:hypothetical protein